MIQAPQLMQQAIQKCQQGIALGESPFGCAIALGDDLLVATHNTVLSSGDITAHAEMNAVRQACQQAGMFLEGAIVASTCEPCPMCMAALHWARVDTVYFGATIADAAASGFNELQLSAAAVLSGGGSCVKLFPGTLTDQCRQLFDEWRQHPRARTY